jgi:hypothetical protein
MKKIFASLLFLFAFSSFEASAYDPPYQCDPSKGTFPDGICKPYATEPNIPSEIRGRLYLACKQGNDVYGARSCCDHLTADLQRVYQVCGKGRNSGFNFSNVPWEEAISIIGLIAY